MHDTLAIWAGDREQRLDIVATILSIAGAAANRVALEACVKARNEGRDLEKEGRDILTEAARNSPELAAAMETWKEIKFEFDTVDKLDVAAG